MKSKHKIYFGVAIVLAVLSWVIAIYYWDKLPGVIPIHFGFDGKANSWADKSVFYVFFIPFLQSLMLTAFGFLYYKPQYSDMPTTMWLMTLNKKNREHAFGLIRNMLAGTAVWVGILLTYISYGSNLSSIDSRWTLSPIILMIIVSLMIVWLAFWSLKVYKATKHAITVIGKK